MIRVAMIGAGSIGFTRRLLMDILAVQELQDTEFRFMDISEENLEMITNLCRKMIERDGLPAKVISTINQREAIKDADYVISTVRVGGLDAFPHDIEIPLKYGVDQSVGDTLGPGGIFYALRSIPVLVGIARDIEDVAPNAYFLNYTNPMAMNCWGVRRATGAKIIGLCHGVQGGHGQISAALGIDPKELDYVCAGINHQTWFVKLSHNGIDVTDKVLEAFEKHEQLSKTEPLRIDVLRRFGYYSTESNGHLSEYLPWYRKGSQEQKDKWLDYSTWIGGETGGYMRVCRENQDSYRENYPKWLSGELESIALGSRSAEHGSYIIESLETGRAYKGCFNVGNTGLITNLPDGCTVELPCTVNGTGIHPHYVGDLPLACAATCRASISVQEMTVEAALTGNKDLVKLAMLHDPLTGAICTPDEVWAMADDMFQALAPWLPQFKG